MSKWRFFVFAMLCLAFCQVDAQSVEVSDGSGGTKGTPTTRQKSPSLKDFFESFGYLITHEFRTFIGLQQDVDDGWNSTQSPRDTVLTYIEGMNAILYDGSEDYERVNQTLPEGYTAKSAETLALKAVFDRIGEVSPIDLPGESSSIRSKANVFEVFPYAVDHEWIWDKLGEAPKGNIFVVRETGGETWKFSEQTLKQAPELLESMLSISPQFNSDNKEALAQRVMYPMWDRTPWWGWVIMLITTVLAFFTGRFVRAKILSIGNTLEKKTKPVIGSIFRSLGTSAGILLGTLVFVAGGSFIELSPLLAELHWNVIKVILIVAVIWIFFGLSDLAGTLVRGHLGERGAEYSVMTVTIMQRVLHSFLFILLAIFALENLLGFNIGALIAGLGIIGLALSLAGKETAQNLFGAVSIFINRPFVVGDWVSFKGNLGEVSDVRMQSTHIRLLSGEMLVVPNMQFVSNEVENLGMRKYLRREMNISLPYGTPPEKVDRAIEVLREVLRSDEVIKEGKCDLYERPPIVSFSDYGDYYLNIKVYYWYYIEDNGQTMQRNSERGWFSYLDHCTIVNQAILRAFDANDLEFAFPTQTIELENKADKDSENKDKVS